MVDLVLRWASFPPGIGQLLAATHSSAFLVHIQGERLDILFTKYGWKLMGFKTAEPRGMRPLCMASHV